MVPTAQLVAIPISNTLPLPATTVAIPSAMMAIDTEEPEAELSTTLPTTTVIPAIQEETRITAIRIPTETTAITATVTPIRALHVTPAPTIQVVQAATAHSEAEASVEAEAAVAAVAVAVADNNHKHSST